MLVVSRARTGVEHVCWRAHRKWWIALLMWRIASLRCLQKLERLPIRLPQVPCRSIRANSIHGIPGA